MKKHNEEGLHETLGALTQEAGDLVHAESLTQVFQCVPCSVFSPFRLDCMSTINPGSCGSVCSCLITDVRVLLYAKFPLWCAECRLGWGTVTAAKCVFFVKVMHIYDVVHSLSKQLESFGDGISNTGTLDIQVCFFTPSST